MTRDTWHVTRDKWHVTCLWGWTFSQSFSSLALTVCDLWYKEDLEEKDDSVTEWINHEAVYRTAPATPCLLKTRCSYFLSGTFARVSLVRDLISRDYLALKVLPMHSVIKLKQVLNNFSQYLSCQTRFIQGCSTYSVIIVLLTERWSSFKYLNHLHV